MRGSNVSQKMSVTMRNRRRYRLEKELLIKKYVVVRKIEKVVISGSWAAENSTAPWQLIIINSEFWFICSLRRLQLGALIYFCTLDLNVCLTALLVKSIPALLTLEYNNYYLCKNHSLILTGCEHQSR